MRRYFRLYGHFVRFSMSKALEFRFDFFFRVFMDLVYYGIQIAFYNVVFLQTPLLGGWNRDQALVFMGAYLVVDGARTHYNANGQPGAKLGSGAVGVRFSNRKQYVLGVEVAKPFADRAIDNDERSPRLNLTLSYQLP